MIMFAMGDVIRNWFDDFFKKSLDDISRPWDMDHLLAVGITKNLKKGGDHLTAVKQWQQTIGNIRPWPLELNRHDLSLPPSAKLQPFDDNDNTGYQDALKTYGLQANDHVLEVSLCSREWLNIDGETVEYKNQNDSKFIIDCFIERMMVIYTKWYEELRINRLFPDYSE